MQPNKVTVGLRNWDMVLVEWQDAFDAAAGWHDQDNYREKECLIKTLGYYWTGTVLDGYIVLAATRGIGQVSQVTHIPLGMVKSITKVETVKKPAKVAKVMGEYKRGTLESSSGAKVKSRKQAVAIAMSEAGMSKPKSKPKKKSKQGKKTR